ncbi:MAG: hypothetical protein AB7E79_14395 [Rhodospirillaceae bacterium]
MIGVPEEISMKRLVSAVVAMMAFGAWPAHAEPDGVTNRTIGYVLTDYDFATYQTPDGKTECPDGYNDGPRERFERFFPKDAPKGALLNAQIAREAAIWGPTMEDEPFPFKYAQGKVAIGLNLDGKAGPNDFISPEGEKGIDNQLYRALGCVVNRRAPGGSLTVFVTTFMQRYNYNRVLLEITDVDSLVDDEDVTVTTYRGRDAIMIDAAGKFLPGGSNRADHKWGKKFITSFKGRIKDGVLTTDPVADWYMPAKYTFQDVTTRWFRDARFRLNLTPDRASGLLAGYTDTENWYRQIIRSLSTHHLSYGEEYAPPLYRAINRLADAFPDENGRNTAISAALEMNFVRVYITHPDRPVASNGGGSSAGTARAAAERR